MTPVPAMVLLDGATTEEEEEEQDEVAEDKVVED